MSTKPSSDVEITVLHWALFGETQDRTTFHGPDLTMCISPNGDLWITHWVSETHTGDTVFACGQWTHAEQRAKAVEFSTGDQA